MRPSHSTHNRVEQDDADNTDLRHYHRLCLRDVFVSVQLAGDLVGDRTNAHLHADARVLNHAEIMAMLREYGLSFAWQKTVTVAYLTALGRRPIGRTTDGRLELVVEHETRGLVDRLTRSTHQQFSIWQMMIATFCVATLLGFVRNFSWSAPTAIDFKYGIPLTLGVATTTPVAVWACLAIRSGRGKMRLAWLAAMTVSVGVPLLMGFHTAGNPLVMVVIATMFEHGALLIGLLSHARYRGFRLVRVQPLERPSLAATPVASDDLLA